MVHTTELSWRRIRRPSDVVSVGDKIHVYVKGFDRERGRISLGYKTEEMNPWYIFTNQYHVGDVVEVKIVSLMPFGAFAEIVPGCDGLIHISQIADHKIAKPDEVLAVGDTVNVRITAIDYDNKKVSLSIRSLLEEAANAAEDEEYAEEPAAEAAPSEGVTVQAKGLTGSFPVTVVLNDDGTVKAVTLGESDSESDKPFLAIANSDDFLGQFVGKTAPFDGIDTTGSATVSKTAILNAVSEVCAQAQ